MGGQPNRCSSAYPIRNDIVLALQRGRPRRLVLKWGRRLGPMAPVFRVIVAGRYRRFLHTGNRGVTPATTPFGQTIHDRPPTKWVCFSSLPSRARLRTIDRPCLSIEDWTDGLAQWRGEWPPRGCDRAGALQGRTILQIRRSRRAKQGIALTHLAEVGRLGSHSDILFAAPARSAANDTPPPVCAASSNSGCSRSAQHALRSCFSD